MSTTDRVENGRGYTIDNCVTCCTFCNMSKGTRSVVEFLAWAQKIVANTRRIPNAA